MKTKEELFNLVKRGARNRSTSATLMNRISSRSHAILQIILEERRMEIHSGIKRKRHKRALFTVVDLAGSERLAKSRSTDIRLEEAKSINKSISALGNCINALASTKQVKHVPFRDSKLTRVLTNSLSGNAQTTLVACISPSLVQYDESLLTLLFACRASGMAMHAVINEEVLIKQRPKTPDLKVESELARKNALLETENESLYKELAELKKGVRGTARSLAGVNKSFSELSQNTNKASSDKTENNNLEVQQASQLIKKMMEVIKRLQSKIAEKVLIQ